MLPAPDSVNQRFPSGPGVMIAGKLDALGVGTSATTPAGVIRPTLPVRSSVNQRARSGPATISSGRLEPVGSGNSVTAPVVVIRPIVAAFAPPAVNQSAPS